MASFCQVVTCKYKMPDVTSLTVVNHRNNPQWTPFSSQCEFITHHDIPDNNSARVAPTGCRKPTRRNRPCRRPGFGCPSTGVRWRSQRSLASSSTLETPCRSRSTSRWRRSLQSRWPTPRSAISTAYRTPSSGNTITCEFASRHIH